MQSLNLSILVAEFSDEDKARALFEEMRWPNGAECPPCGAGDPYRPTPRPSKSPVRPGVWKCRACRKQFTVRVGTIFESSKVSLRKSLLAIHLLCASKKGMSSHQLHRMLGVQYRTAWFMAHRLRYVMAQDSLLAPMEGIVEMDETFVGGKPRYTAKNPPLRDASGRRRRGPRPGTVAGAKVPVISILQRGGPVRSYAIERVTSRTLGAAIRETVDESRAVAPRPARHRPVRDRVERPLPCPPL